MIWKNIQSIISVVQIFASRGFLQNVQNLAPYKNCPTIQYESDRLSFRLHFNLLKVFMLHKYCILFPFTLVSRGLMASRPPFICGV